MKNKQRKIQATFLATVLLLGSGLGMLSENVKAESATSATVIVDEPFTDLNILTRTKGSYSTDMVYTMIYDTLFTLDGNGNFDSNLVEFSTFSTEVSHTSLPSGSYPNINYAPGWEVQPIFEVELTMSDFSGSYSVCCELRDDVTFQNEMPLTVDNLIALVNYAKAQPTNTLIYQTWAPVTIDYIDNYTFDLSIDTTGFDFGIMDVLYNLASPQGSIVDVGEWGIGTAGYPLGTGAYMLDEIVTDSTEGSTEYSTVEFERWDDWWNTTEVPTQYVTFEYVGDSDNAKMDFFTGVGDAVIIRTADTLTNELEVEMGVDNFDVENQLKWLEEDPLALYFNLDSEESIFGINEYRKAVAAGMDKNVFRESGGLDFDSEDFWCYLRNSHSTTNIPVNNMNYAQSLIGSTGVIIGGIQIDVVVYDDSYFANETAYQYYCSVRDTLCDYLEELFSYVVNVNMIEASESQMATYESNGNYDIILKEIDLHNINSAHKTLYGKGSTDIDNWLNKALSTVTVNSYMLTHLYAQYYNYAEESYVTNLGWQKRALLLQDNVSGVTPYEGFCPTGDSSRLDFRFIEVTIN